MIEYFAMIEESIQVSGLGKCFRFYTNRWHKLRGLLLNSRNHCQPVWGVRDLNFSLARGNTLAVIGANGSGKTTLLQLLAGLLKPTEGCVQIHGTLATLLELGAGFQPELTGRENIFTSGGIRGFSKKEIERRLTDIIRFAELEDFIDHPIKHYSSGMLMRLAFAVAINIEPDVLLIDEFFAVGDIAFQHKCTRKFRELQKKGVTTVLVTHDLVAAKSLCNIALLLDRGNQIRFGSPEEVTNHYIELIFRKVSDEPVEYAETSSEQIETDSQLAFISELPESEKMQRHGSGQGKICGIQILNSAGVPTSNVGFGQEVTFRFFIEYYEDVSVSGIGFYLRDRYGNDITAINTFEEGKTLGSRRAGDRLVVDFKLTLFLRTGTYSVSPGLSEHPNEARHLDWIDSAVFFEMQKPLDGKEIYGFTYIPNCVSVKNINKSDS